MITTVLWIWVILSMLYIDSGMKFITKINNPYKIGLFAVLLGPVFWVLLILAVFCASIFLSYEYISEKITPVTKKIKNWWTI